MVECFREWICLEEVLPVLVPPCVSDSGVGRDIKEECRHRRQAFCDSCPFVKHVVNHHEAKRDIWAS